MDMKCPICGTTDLKTINTRSTRHGTQTWRRKECKRCYSVITTYEKPDLAWLVIKDPFKGSQTPYKRFLLSKSIFDAFDNESASAVDIDGLVDSIEIKLINSKKTTIDKQELIATVLKSLKPVSINAYMSYMAAHTAPHNLHELTTMIKDI
jgi:transcriptional regulator NrdR family protein